MKNFLKNHFKFILSFIWFTFLFINISENSRKEFSYLESKLEIIDYMNECNIKYIQMKFKELDKTVLKTGQILFNEDLLIKAHIYTMYVEVIQCLNNHKELNNKPWEIYDLKEILDGFNKAYDKVIENKGNLT
jgi:hypothetical protein